MFPFKVFTYSFGGSRVYLEVFMKTVLSLVAFIFLSLAGHAESNSIYGSYRPVKSAACRALNITRKVYVSRPSPQVPPAATSPGCFKFGRNDCEPGQSGSFQYGEFLFQFADGSLATITTGGVALSGQSYTVSISPNYVLTIVAYLTDQPISCSAVKI